MDEALLVGVVKPPGGLHRDVETMVHEAGHAFHSMLSRHHALQPHRDYPIEIAEVASMSMELLTAPYLTVDRGGFYTPKEAARARIEALEARVARLEGSQGEA